jgi:primosomal protein N'
MIALGVIGRKREAVAEAAERYAAELRRTADGEVLGPAPFQIPRVNDEWRYRIAIKTRAGVEVRRIIRERLGPAARNDRGTRLAVNVDP